MSESTHRDTEPAASRVVLAVTGGIAVYKAIEVMRGLQHAGCDVRVTMTADAERFVGTPTFEALSGHPVDKGFSGSSAVESYIPDDDVFSRVEPAVFWRMNNQPSAGEAFAKIVIAVSGQMNGDPFWQECPE